MLDADLRRAAYPGAGKIHRVFASRSFEMKKQDKLRILRSTELFARVEEPELADVLLSSSLVTLNCGEMLFTAGQPSRGMFIIVQGSVRVFHQDRSGREQVVHVDVCGATLAEMPMFDDGPYPASCMAETAATVLMIPKSVVQQLASRNHGFLWNAVKILARRLRAQAQLVHEISLQSVDQRLARFLWSEASQHVQPRATTAAFALRYKMHEIASRLGTVREVVSRAMTRLETMGLLKRGPGSFVIQDLSKLQAFAEQAPMRNRPAPKAPLPGANMSADLSTAAENGAQIVPKPAGKRTRSD